MLSRMYRKIFKYPTTDLFEKADFQMLYEQNIEFHGVTRTIRLDQSQRLNGHKIIFSQKKLMKLQVTKFVLSD